MFQYKKAFVCNFFEKCREEKQESRSKFRVFAYSEDTHFPRQRITVLQTVTLGHFLTAKTVDIYRFFVPLNIHFCCWKVTIE